MHTNFTRRNFIAASSAAFAGITILPRSVFGANEKVNLAFVGVGRKGNHAVRFTSTNSTNFVAFADVNRKMAQESVEAHPHVPLYTDFREMMDKHDKDIDGVIVSTPDHFHHYATKYCMQMGKGVYVEKPMCHRISDCRDLKAAELEYKVACQMGNQGHSSATGAYLADELYKGGVLGEVGEVWCWLNSNRSRPDEIPAEQPVPDYIHWDTWLGSSPVYPYNGVYFYSGNWRCFNMFGAGGLGDMGCHTFNMAVYVLDLDWPSEIQVVSDHAYQYSYPENGFELIYTFAATDKRGPVKLRWFCGAHKPPRPEQLEPAREMGSNMGGSILFGSKQTLMTDSHCRRSVIIPETNRRAIVEDLKQYRPQNFGRGTHYGNWMQALKGEGTCRSNFQYASRLTEIVLLGDIASRLNRMLKLDPATRTIIGDEQAQAMMIAAPARDGWAL